MVNSMDFGALVGRVPMLTAAGAGQAVAAAEAAARLEGGAVVIAVVDAQGQLIALLRMDGAPLIGISVAQAKASTAAQLRTPTVALQRLVDGGTFSLLAAQGLAPMEGGVPVVIDGVAVGAVGVSGMDGPTDARVAQAAVDALLGGASDQDVRAHVRSE